MRSYKRHGCTVIITLHNYEETIARAIRSAAKAIAQINNDGDIVLVDDNSTDNGKAVAIGELIRTGLPYQVIDPPRPHNLALNRNVGLEAAERDWVFTLDADNEIAPHGLQVLIAEAEQAGADAAYGMLQILDHGQNMGLLSEAPYSYEMLLKRPYIDAMGLFRRETLVELGGYSEACSDICNGWEDWHLWLKLGKTGKTVQFSPQIVGNYHRRSGSVSRTMENQDKLTHSHG